MLGKARLAVTGAATSATELIRRTSTATSVFDISSILRGANRAAKDKLAINDVDHGVKMRYSDLFSRAGSLAQDLSRSIGGAEPFTTGIAGAPRPYATATGPRVAVLADASDYVTAQWATWMVGAVSVPLCPQHPPAEMAHALRTAGCSAVLIPPTTASNHGKYSALLEAVRAKLREDDGPAAAEFDVFQVPQTISFDTDFEPSSVDGLIPSWVSDSAVVPAPEHVPAMMLFTSGTTSLPKGVLHTHGSLGAIVESLRSAWSWSGDDHILHTLPMHHMHGVANIAACAQASGATVRWRPDGFRVQDAWADLLHCDDLNVFMGVPTMYARMLSGMSKLSDAERRMVGDLGQKFRLMVAGSAALPATVATRWREATGVALVERYGMTEVGMALSNGRTQDTMAFGTVGSPLPGVECAIVGMAPDADDAEAAGGDAEAETAPSGELWIRGPMLFAGYWNRASANADELVSAEGAMARGVSVLDPVMDCHAAETGGERQLEGFGAGNGNPWFRTGDIAQVDERGFWKILGRASVDIIKSGGYKVSALEVETAVLDHPAVEEVAVLGMPDEADMGETITAVVVLQPGQDLDIAALRAFCDESLAKYKQPRDLIVLNAFERNAMGKINKKLLRNSLVAARQQ